MYQMIFLNSLTHRTPRFSFIPHFCRILPQEKQHLVFAPSYLRCLQALHLLTFLFIYFKSSRGKKIHFSNPFQLCKYSRLGYFILLFLESFSPNEPKPRMFSWKTENSMNDEKKRWHLRQPQVLFVRSGISPQPGLVGTSLDC